MEVSTFGVSFRDPSFVVVALKSLLACVVLELSFESWVKIFGLPFSTQIDKKVLALKIGYAFGPAIVNPKLAYAMASLAESS